MNGILGLEIVEIFVLMIDISFDTGIWFTKEVKEVVWGTFKIVEIRKDRSGLYLSGNKVKCPPILSVSEIKI